MLGNRRGILLISVYLIIAVITVLLSSFLFRAVWNGKNAQSQKNHFWAMQCAEAAIDEALVRLPAFTSPATAVNLTDRAQVVRGQYSYAITTLVLGKEWRIDSLGYAPSVAQAQANTKDIARLQAFVAKKDLPFSFWGSALYTAGNLRVNGNAFTVDGNVLYAGSLLVQHQAGLIGTTAKDPTISPLVRLDFNSLRQIAGTQIKADGSDNIYTAEEIFSKNPPLPTEFWFDKSDPDPSKWIPNVVYLEDDLTLNGTFGKIGGFVIVVGDVLTDPDVTTSTVINGCGFIDGCVYSTGEFRVNGGGAQGLNVLGGVWSGSDGIRLNGTVDIKYYEPYMNAIRYNINPSTVLQLVSWRNLDEG
ncbi:MAG: hypothetical protein NC924_05515 [Candidatus Omnitrophica bacterium]|nr:hypothetical protein [Candidatus Omnitrophota bacterium]